MSHPNILVLGLMKEDYLSHLFESLMSSMREVATVKLVTRAKEAKTLLEAHPPPAAVLSIDAGPTESKNRALNEQLVRYAKAGGTVVFGCNFSNHFSFGSAPAFFTAWGVPWTLGDYHRTTVYLNTNGVPGMDLSGLKVSYSAKALNLANVPPKSAVYTPNSTSLTQSHVFPSLPVDASQTPAAYAEIGMGYMGYTGDVNAEEPTDRTIMAMLHLPFDHVGSRSRTRTAHSVAISPWNLWHGPQFLDSDSEEDSEDDSEEDSDEHSGWHGTPRGIPPHVLPPFPRPKEAQVKARVAQRAKTAARRKAQAEKFKEKGNDAFRAGNFKQAITFYQKASKTYKPLPIYMSNLAATLMKLERWEEAEAAADHATLVDPNFVKAYFRRGIARIHCDKLDGALRDFKRCLELDPSCAEAKTEMEKVRSSRAAGEKAGIDSDVDSDSEAKLVFALGREFVPGRTLHVLDCPSDTEEYHHVGNRKPCRYYNHGGCQFGKACRFMHAPDHRSVRDELGRNVCLFFLIDRCMFGGECLYAHDKTYLPSNGWWNEELLGGWQRLYDDCKEDMEDGIIDKIGVVMNGSAMPWVIERNLQELTNNYLEASGGGDLDDDSESEYGFSSYPRRGKNTAQEMQERAENFGFTVDEVNELLCQGVKPWDDDTWDVVHALENL